MGRTGANRSGGTDESHLALKDMAESRQTTCSTRPDSEKMDFAKQENKKRTQHSDNQQMELSPRYHYVGIVFHVNRNNVPVDMEQHSS